MEQILAEAALLDLGLEIPVGGGDDARVERELARRRRPGGRVRSCSTRRSFACSSSGISPISSRNTVPAAGLQEQAGARGAARR